MFFSPVCSVWYEYRKYYKVSDSLHHGVLCSYWPLSTHQLLYHCIPFPCPFTSPVFILHTTTNCRGNTVDINGHDLFGKCFFILHPKVQMHNGDIYEASIRDIDKKSDIATIKINTQVGINCFLRNKQTIKKQTALTAASFLKWL